MRLLTDTHSLVWALSNPELLGTHARAALPQSEVSASVVNLWELCLKAARPGSLLDHPEDWWDRYVTRAGIPVLPIRVSHVLRLGSLADIHRDPFDRLLIAQCAVEKLTLVTKDGTLAQYGVPVIW